MGESNRVCPSCGRKMKQQFIGLQHCKCGTSWMKSMGYFQRTPNMVFCLKRKHFGKKVKQIPTIEYHGQTNEAPFADEDMEFNNDAFEMENIDVMPVGIPDNAFTFIPISAFADNVMKNNKGYQRAELVQALTETLRAKKNGAKCRQCGAPIWAAGSAIVQEYLCFTCLTGEANSSDDYEIK